MSIFTNVFCLVFVLFSVLNSALADDMQTASGDTATTNYDSNWIPSETNPSPGPRGGQNTNMPVAIDDMKYDPYARPEGTPGVSGGSSGGAALANPSGYAGGAGADYKAPAGGPVPPKGPHMVLPAYDNSGGANRNLATPSSRGAR